MFSFSVALEALNSGKRVARNGWNGKGMFLLLIYPITNDQYSIIEKPGLVGTLMSYVAMKTADNGLTPWQPSQADMLSSDWTIIE